MKDCSHCGHSLDDATLRCPDDGTVLAVVAGVFGPEEKPLVAGAELGSYRILDLLGEGDMGFVYVAEHRRTLVLVWLRRRRLRQLRQLRRRGVRGLWAATPGCQQRPAA